MGLTVYYDWKTKADAASAWRMIRKFDQIAETGAKGQIRDDSKYARHRDIERLLRNLREWDAIIARFVGNFSDAFNKAAADADLSMVAPIKERPDFEHLEAKGIEVIKKMAARQRRRQQRRRDKPS